MMILKNIFIYAFLMAVLPLGLHAKENAKIDLKEIKHPVKPMLWKIEGKGLEEPSYLFGTIHIADPRVITLHPLAKQAFDQAASVYTEIDLSPAKQVEAAPLYMRGGDQTLEQIVGKETVAAIEAELKVINPVLNIKPFEKLKLWALVFMMPQLESQLGGKLPLDMLLWKQAEKAGKKMGALEKIEDQLGKMDKLTIEEQKELLRVTLKLLKLSREKKVNPYQGIIDAYLLGDTAAIEKEMSKTNFMGLKINPEINKKLLTLLLDERNVGMAKSIQDAISAPDAGSCFFAAGSAHYIGDKSVNGLLKKAGYTVTPVTK